MLPLCLYMQLVQHGVCVHDPGEAVSGGDVGALTGLPVHQGGGKLQPASHARHTLPWNKHITGKLGFII